MIYTAIFTVFLASVFDVLTKERYVKGYLLPAKYKGLWQELPDFWKDKIPNDKWYRIRYAIVLNFVFMVLAGLMSWSIYGSLIYIYLCLINLEHVLYQILVSFTDKNRALFDLEDEPGWMEGLPWNKMFARYHGKDTVTSEEILVILGAGLILMFAVNFVLGV